MYLQISDQINAPSVQAVEGAERMNDCYRFAHDRFHGEGPPGRLNHRSFAAADIHLGSECFRITADSLNLITGN